MSLRFDNGSDVMLNAEAMIREARPSAEIEVLDRQCFDRRKSDQFTHIARVDAWQQHRTVEQRTIEWRFTRQDEDQKMQHRYVS